LNSSTFNRNTINGKITDLRFYNGDNITGTVAALASSLYAAGSNASGNTDGLVFQAFVVMGAGRARYDGLTLTEDDKVLDNVGGAVGTPYGGPISTIV